jgi:uncharacterized protein YbjT (DUF2867 family)
MKILVTGATGKQGGVVIDHLLSGSFGDHEVYGLTRDLSAAAAQRLVDRGVHVVEGDLRDRDRMAALLEGIDGVFAVTTFFEDGPERETEQGITLADAAAEAGVSHFVYSSVSAADRAPLAHFQSKFAVEEHVTELGLPTTVIRPAYFMQNFEWLRDDIESGTLQLPLSPETVLHMVDATDIGLAVAMSFADPDSFLGETVELVGDAPTLAEVAVTFSEALAVPVEFVSIPLDEYREARGDELAAMYAWFDDGAYDTTLPDLSRFGLTPRTLVQYLAENDTWRPAPAPVE